MTTDLQVVDRPTDFATTREVWATQMRNAALNTLNDRLTDYRLSYLNRDIEFGAADHYTAALFALQTANAELMAIEEKMRNEHTGDLRSDSDGDDLPGHDHGGGDVRSADSDRESGGSARPVAVHVTPYEPRGQEAILTWLPTPLFISPDREPDPPAVA